MVHHLQSYQSVLQKHLSDLNNLCQGIPHTYCQDSISLLIHHDIQVALTF